MIDNQMTPEMLEWIRGLIWTDNLHEFYTSPVWRRMQAHVLKANHYECARCKAKGKVVKASTVHHKEYLRNRPELALDENNLEPICAACHYDEHHRKKQYINEERW
jgi:5-methylcytosine-specific restriction endonuclease McrA